MKSSPKSSSFWLRIAICLLLSLFPAGEIDQYIYSARIRSRGNSEALKLQHPERVHFAIITLSSSQIENPEYLKALRQRLKNEHGTQQVLVVPPQGSPELITDNDGQIRRAALLHSGGSSLAYKAFSILQPDIQILRKLQSPNLSHLINYLGPRGTVTVCSWARLKDCPNLNGSIALVTEEDDGFSPLRTPFGEMSRAEVLANDLHTVLNRRAMTEANFFEIMMMCLAVIFFCSVFIINAPAMRLVLTITAAAFALLFALFQILFDYLNIYVPSANIAGAFLITYVIFTLYRLSLQDTLRWKAMQQANYLRELDHLKTNFLSLVSHDLKTPVAKIQAVVEQLRREPRLQDWRAQFDSIENSNNELKRYITSVLSLSRIESQQVILNKKSNDINRIISNSLTRLKPLADQRQISIIENLEPLFAVECDEELMRQVISNLIDNAIKYSPPGSKIIVHSSEEKTKDGRDIIRVDVQDFGRGIPQDQLPLIFRKFNRFLRPLKDNVKGSGLGLYLSKYFIEMHGGTITVKSDAKAGEGQGTTFSITLPIQ